MGPVLSFQTFFHMITSEKAAFITAHEQEKSMLCDCPSVYLCQIMYHISILDGAQPVRNHDNSVMLA
jgi:hypothetical protein